MFEHNADFFRRFWLEFNLPFVLHFVVVVQNLIGMIAYESYINNYAHMRIIKAGKTVYVYITDYGVLLNVEAANQTYTLSLPKYLYYANKTI